MSNIRVARPWGSGARIADASHLAPIAIDDTPQPNALAYRGAGTVEKTLSAWSRRNYSVDSAILPNKRIIEGGVGDLVRNNGFVAGLRQTNVDNIIGPRGLRLGAKPDYIALGRDEAWAEEWARNTESKFRLYANDPNECDVAGLHDFADQQTIHYFNTFEFGDAFSLPMWVPSRPGRKWSTAFQGIQPPRVRNPLATLDKANFRAGIETNEYGEPIKYHVAVRNPDDSNAFGDWTKRYQTVAVDARTAWGRKRMIHLLKRQQFGQTRGISPMAPLIALWKEADMFKDAVSKQQILTNFIGLIIESTDENLLQYFGGSKDDVTAYLELMAGRASPDFNGGGNVLQLKPGEKATMVSPNLNGVQIDAYFDYLLQELQAGSNLPHELLTKDFSKSSYVGIRAGLAEAVRFFKGDREWLATGFCQPFYELWLEEAVNSGEVEAPGFYENISAYSRAKWLGAQYSFTDRVKEITASVMAIESCLSDYEEEIGMIRGEDWRDVFAQAAREKAYAEKLGLSIVAGPVAIAAAGAPQMDGNNPLSEPPPPNKKR
jgi:lambda family phage portal protein